MGTIILKLFLESLAAIGGRLALAVVAERFLSRMVAKGIRGLAKLGQKYGISAFTPEDAEALIEGMKRTDLPKLK